MRLAFACLVLSLTACNPAAMTPPAGTRAAFDLDADLAQPAHFFDLPYPSDLRLLPSGAPDLRGFPNPDEVAMIDALGKAAMERRGFPVIPVAYFRFDAPIAPRDADAVIPAGPTAPILLIDVDPDSPERGRLFPVMAATPPPDAYVPANLLAVAPRHGMILHADRRYAFAVRRAMGDAAGKPLDAPAVFAALQQGRTPDGTRGKAAADSFAPLWPALTKAGIDPADLAAATVFKTGDVVADTNALSSSLLQKYSVQIEDLKAGTADGRGRYCELIGHVKYPQFQTGTPPFNSDGTFNFSDNGLPAKQRDEDAPISIILPNAPMPAGGYPLMLYFHGSGGLSEDVINDGPTLVKGGEAQLGTGPGYVLAALGIASAGSALPVNPERVPGAVESAYINLNNPVALRDVFRQGVIEQRLYLEALRKIRIPPAALGACTGPTLENGETAFHFDSNKLIAQGQSMGGMYTNFMAAVEPGFKIAVPTGAGGFWGYFILKTSYIAGAAKLIGVLLHTDAPLTVLHPAMHLLVTAWEPADPIVYMPRIGRRPLPGHPARPVYEPAGKDDRYFPTPVYDAVALSYGHQQAGDVIWPAMQESLALDGLDGIRPYPVKDNRPSEAGGAYTGVVVQYSGDGIADPHSIYRQLDAVKYQYGCFVSTFLRTGHAIVPAPQPLGTPCPN